MTTFSCRFLFRCAGDTKTGPGPKPTALVCVTETANTVSVNGRWICKGDSEPPGRQRQELWRATRLGAQLGAGLRAGRRLLMPHPQKQIEDALGTEPWGTIVNLAMRRQAPIKGLSGSAGGAMQA
uniref:Uncharacterized protein n=1 Tax=Lotharella globosa TaxID=91324 RepID=A0A6U2XT08_9EUKA|mmetsp:Transcript_14175/g.27874  ORF Transcript_14175/g.27874 Transcript_14175/m.27874 type:complete len:125 (+) Transcript_14175:128-502(+)